MALGKLTVDELLDLDLKEKDVWDWIDRRMETRKSISVGYEEVKEEMETLWKMLKDVDKDLDVLFKVKEIVMKKEEERS